MQNLKKDRAIIFIANKDYTFALASMLVNLNDEVKLDCSVVVYHFGISKEEKEALLRIKENIDFIEYTYDDWVKEHDEIDIESKACQAFIARFTHLALSKYKIFEQLQNFHKILYLDLDMLILDNISEIFDFDGIAWRTESEFHRKFGSKENKPEFTELNSIPLDYPAPNGGLIFASDIIDWKKCIADGQHFINIYASYFSSVVDELSLSWIAYNNVHNVHELDYRLYNTLTRVSNEKTKIVHFMGKQKTWNDELLNYGFPNWFKNYTKAVDISGFEFKTLEPFETHGQIYRKIYNQNRWLSVLDKISEILPNTLEINFNLSSETLTLKFNDFISYTFSLSRNHYLYTVKLHIDSSILMSDQLILDEADKVLKRIPDLISSKRTRSSLTLSSKWLEETKAFSFFQHFYEMTKPLIQPSSKTYVSF